MVCIGQSQITLQVLDSQPMAESNVLAANLSVDEGVVASLVAQVSAG
jgi:hypothetical protein